MSTRSSSRIGYHHCLGECGAINTSTHGFFRCFQYLRYQYWWGEHLQTFFSMSYWVNLLPKIPVADPKRGAKKTLATACFLSIFGVYTSIFGVENFKKNLFTNSCFIRLHSVIWYPCWPLWQSSANKFFLPGMWAAWITIPGFAPLKYLPNKATQLKGLRPPPLPYWKNMTPLLSCLNRIHALQQYAFEMNLS